MRDCRAKTANGIKYQEFLGSPVILQDGTKHPEGEHIIEDMFPGTMKKEIGDQLMGPKKGRMKVMQCKQLFHSLPELYSHSGFCEIYQHVDYNQILNNRRY
jgi:hypothetical protein